MANADICHHIVGNIRAFKRIVGSLRATGYDGHIILGVSKDINAP